MKETQVLVGEITAPFGVQGEVKLHAFVDSLDVLTQFSVVYLQSLSGNSCETRITTVRLHQGDTVIARIEAIADRDAADAWRHTKIYVNRSDMPALSEGAYYEWELLGLTVVTESGKPLGVLGKIHHHPANDVYETEVAMIPAVEAFVKSVDTVEKQMVVIDMPGLRKDE
jgi:16S rRNA processing protein RimM